MKTYADLKAFVEKTNCEYELNPLFSTYEHYNIVEGKMETKSYQIGWEFGIKNISGRKGIAEWAWTWFQFDFIGRETLTDNAPFFFRNRYNAATGYEDKSLDGMLRAEMMIAKRMAR